MTQSADLIESNDATGRTVAFTGSLALAQLGDLPNRTEAIEGDVARIDLTQVTQIDTIGAWIVHSLAKRTQAKITGASDDAMRLIDVVSRNDQPLETRNVPPHPIVRILEEVGVATRMTFNTMIGLLGFLGAVVITSFMLLRHPSRIRLIAVVQRIEVVGISALFIIGLMSFLVGIVIAQQGSVQLEQFGMEVLTVNLVGRLTFRELGVLMTAIMVAGRSGSAFAAQIGTMQLNEEVDAMRTIGVSPMEALVMPRIMAAVIMMPLLGFYASVMAVIGGAFLCAVSLDIPPVTFFQRLREVVPLTDLYIGLIKAPVFGLIIAIAGCFQGLQVRGNAEEVGLRTTAAVVQAIFIVIVLDAIFAVFFTWLGWK
ncbi:MULTISPECIES: ABC transporter permease [unclassified Sphingobium]|uniref:ABC transporter permease n=1 Tax=unclassified Sphingobium TaxID=2611147 RepID=UPI00222538C4|nr:MULTISPECIES: ABC transporter permease [unclassified Sphingobium]MCW2383268.1 phospholipid/cholesterol/gamma-HCH transport system permease protein [Sphingobium sp. B2D3B]MCW2399757.1 phospholipid/cholesterol/gamma-HCH transport system permease protein [Sphingobium sp. B2D3C]